MKGEKEVSVDGGDDEKEDGEKEEEAVVRDGEKEESGEENGDALNLMGGVEPIFLEFNWDKLLADCHRMSLFFICIFHFIFMRFLMFS